MIPFSRLYLILSSHTFQLFIAQLKQLAPILYKIFGIESKDCYRFYTDIKRRKNESRTYFLDKMQEKLNERMLRDEELERMRR